MKTQLHKIALFSLDHTLLRGSLAERIAESYCITPNHAMREDLGVKLQITAQKLAGTHQLDLFRIVDEIPLTAGVKNAVHRLQQEGYITAIASTAYDFAANRIGKQLGIDFVFAPKLEFIQQKVSGRVHIPACFQKSAQPWCEHSFCSGHVIQFISEQCGIALTEIVAIGNDPQDSCMLSIAGCAISDNRCQCSAAATNPNHKLNWLITWNSKEF